MSTASGAGGFAYSHTTSGEVTIVDILSRSVLREAIEKIYDPAQSCSLVVVGIDDPALTRPAVHDAVGEKTLGAVGERLRNLVGDNLLGRLGQQVFVVFRDDHTGRHLGHEIVRAAREPFTINDTGAPGAQVSLTVSVGVALGPHHGSNLADLYRSAEHAAERAKDAGGDRAHISILRSLQPSEVMPASQQLAATVRELMGILGNDERSTSWVHDLVAAYEDARTGGRSEFLAFAEMDFASTAPPALEQNARCRHLKRRIEDLTLVLARSASK